MASTEIDPATTPVVLARSDDDDIRDLAGGALVVFLGKMARASRGAFIWVITLLCGLDVQGLYSLAWAVTSTLNKVGRFGMERTAVYYIASARAAGDRSDAEVPQAIAAGCALTLAASAVALVVQLLAADWIAAFYGKPIAGAIRIMAWTTPLIGVSWVFTSATRALRIMRYEVYVRSVAGPLILFVGGAAVGLAGLGLEAVSWVQLAMGAGVLLLGLYYFARHFSIAAAARAWGRGMPWRAMARFSVPVMLADLLYAVLTELDVFMLGWFVSAELVGIFVLVRRVASIMLKAPQAFDAIFSSIVSELSAQERHRELGDRFVVISRWILTVNLPLFAGLLLAGDPVLTVLGAREFAGVEQLQLGLQILFVLCVGMLVQSVFAVSESLLAMTGSPGLNLANNLLWLGLNFGLNLWLIDDYGLVGAAVGASAAMIAVNLLRLVQVWYIRRIPPCRGSQLKPLLAAAVAALPAWWLRALAVGLWWRIALPCAAFGLAYAGLLWLLGPEPEDRTLLRRVGRGLVARLAGRPGS